MISLSPAAAVMLYLTLTISALFGLWIRQHLRRKKQRIFSDRSELYMCEYCQQVYVSDPLKPVNKCPECKSFNKNNRYGN